MNTNKVRYFVGDFETTVYDGQTDTEVWASGIVELFTEDVKILHSIQDTWRYLCSLTGNIVVYYHNLKFDGNFWLWFFEYELKLKQAITKTGENEDDIEFKKNYIMSSGEYKYSISNMGQWYTITVKVGNRTIEFRDSLKLLPFSIKAIGKSFATKHKKLDMEYKGYRYAGCEITEEEKKYLTNDLLVAKEALEIMFNEGHNKLTIGSCCLSEYKTIYDKQTSFNMHLPEFETIFPDLYKLELGEKYGAVNVGEYIRKSYKGGWCYLVKGKENKIYKNGTTADVNSLYPSMMLSESGNRFPTGHPTFWSGNFIPDKAIGEDKFFFIRIRTRFYLKENMLPFIQIKGSLLYKSTEALETSDIYDKKTGKYCRYYTWGKGEEKEVREAKVTLTLTQMDYYLILKHYELVDFEILDGCYFHSEIGIFDDYIEKYATIKQNSKGAKRSLAKLFLNNLYGKMATNTDSSFKLAYKDEENENIRFRTIHANNKKSGYIPIGSAITSYARCFTINAAQQNYHGANERGFIYADTDSIHCDLLQEEIQGIKVHDTAFCCWKLEACWDKAIFARQKTYIEHVTHEDLQKIDTPYNNIKCAGMPQKCKDLLEHSFKGTFTNEVAEKDKETWNKYTEDEKEFVKEKRTYDDFKQGLIVPGKLMPVRIKGGVLLKDTTYEMR